MKHWHIPIGPGFRPLIQKQGIKIGLSAAVFLSCSSISDFFLHTQQTSYSWFSFIGMQMNASLGVQNGCKELGVRDWRRHLSKSAMFALRDSKPFSKCLNCTKNMILSPPSKMSFFCWCLYLSLVSFQMVLSRRADNCWVGSSVILTTIEEEVDVETLMACFTSHFHHHRILFRAVAGCLVGLDAWLVWLGAVSWCCSSLCRWVGPTQSQSTFPLQDKKPWFSSAVYLGSLTSILCFCCT
jgi:hypothetical protein